MSAKISIYLFDDEDKLLNGLSEIKSDELCLHYSDIGGYYHGLQSDCEGDRYNKQLEICSKIIQLCRELKEVSE